MKNKKISRIIICLIAMVMVFTGSFSMSFAAENTQVTSLSKPQNLYVCGNGKDGIKISWNKVSGATDYAVFRAKAYYSGKSNFVNPVKETNFKKIKTVSGTSYLDKDVKKGNYEIYYYRVQPINDSGDSVVKGPFTHAQPGTIKIEGASVNAFPDIQFKLSQSKVTAPGSVNIKVSVKNIDKKLSPYLREFEFIADEDNWDRAYVAIPDNKSNLELTTQIRITGNTQMHLNETYLNGEKSIFRLSLAYKYDSSLGKRSGMSIEYPVWSYGTNISYSIVTAYDNIAFRAWLTDKNLTSKIKNMKNGKVAFLKIKGNWNPKGIVKKEYLDAIKGTNKVIVARVLTEGGDACDWIFYGNKIKNTKDIRIGYMHYTDFEKNGDEIHSFGFYKNGALPTGTEIKMERYSFSEYTDGMYIDWIKGLMNTGYKRFTFDNSKDTKTRTKVPGEATFKDGWIYFKIDPQYSIKNQTVTLSAKNFAYNGNNKRPGVTIKKGNRKLLKGTDYTITYPSQSKEMGRYKITIKGKSLFKGTKTVYYTVGPKATSKVNGTVSGNNVEVKWNKVSKATGYAVYYKKAANSTYKLAGHTTKASYTIKNITGTGKYNIKVVPYKNIDKVKCYGGAKTISVTK